MALLVISGFCRANPPTVAAPTSIYVVETPIFQPPPGDFIAHVLQMSLEASKKKGETIEVRFSQQGLSQARLITTVQQGDSNSVMWTISNIERENTLRPIRIPLFKGLLGYRSLLIRKQDQARFAKINTPAELAHYIAGQGEDWPDTRILRSNQLPVTEGSTHKNLYKMLVAGRFDYFPRGITETSEEADLIKRYDLLVEPHLILYYPTAMYFFVHKENHELAQRLEKGLKLIQENGDFDRLFYALPRVQTALAALSDDKRNILTLNNPDFLEQITYPPSYWREEAQGHLLSTSTTKSGSRH